jgi:hypothetical protein
MVKKKQVVEKAKAKAPSAALVELYEGLQTNVFETVFPRDKALITAFLAWARKTHPRWDEEVDEDDGPAGRAVKLEILITDEVEEAAFVAFFETLPAAQKKAAIAAMTAAGSSSEEEEEDEEEDAEADPSELDLRGKGLTELPADVATRTGVEKLLLARNKLATLPVWIGKLKKLEMIDLSENPIGALPAELAQCKKLKTLILFNCKDAIVPAIPSLRIVSAQTTSLATVLSLGASPGLVDVAAQTSGLTAVPEVLRRMKKLRRLDLSGNRITALPRWLAELPIKGLYTFDCPMPPSEMEWARAALKL